ncbi:MAG: HesA/MoeB/ThiF family protein [Nanoarchaeota archaeon]|nr:HesA/MoeB/ThiF family protein [Nanoarchaeota archaeon]MBU4299803.1 HesA/MoeB/ThiF family protein [Nanoarchaeota archaeon]MBU4452209.1 HesA/MoeB/ThiF family protein [Nanoarchaeota archaeon]MCG2723595.1 HesA/MoeB/ThiF family protein [archaeon]
MISPERAVRYSRQIAFDTIGKLGQKKLSRAKVAIIGLGGLGSVAAMILARAGVGYLRMIDRDIVEPDNLQRQVLFDESDIGATKSFVSKKRLSAINSGIKIDAICDDLDEKTAKKLLSGVDIILDGTDNMEARMIINAFAVKNKIPYIYGASVRDKGMALAVLPGKTACLKCVFQRVSGLEMDCGRLGVIPTATGLIATIEANEALKIICGFGKTLAGKLFYADLLENRFDVLDVKRNSKCDVCGKKQ